MGYSFAPLCVGLAALCVTKRVRGEEKTRVEKANQESLAFIMARRDQWTVHYNMGNYRLTPANRLRRRPDVRMAEFEAWSQCARIGVAKGELLPSFSLLGSIGVASSHTGNFFDDKSFRSIYGGAFNWNPIIYPFTIEPVRFADTKFQETSVRLLGTQDKLKTLHRECQVFAPCHRTGARPV